VSVRETYRDGAGDEGGDLAVPKAGGLDDWPAGDLVPQCPDVGEEVHAEECDGSEHVVVAGHRVCPSELDESAHLAL
jgi:hypothetical protein